MCVTGVGVAKSSAEEKIRLSLQQRKRKVRYKWGEAGRKRSSDNSSQVQNEGAFSIIWEKER